MGIINSPKYTCYLVYFSVLILIALLIIMETGLSYVSDKGCYRIYASQSGTLTSPYINLYDPLQASCQKVVWYLCDHFIFSIFLHLALFKTYFLISKTK